MEAKDTLPTICKTNQSSFFGAQLKKGEDFINKVLLVLSIKLFRALNQGPTFPRLTKLHRLSLDVYLLMPLWFFLYNGTRLIKLYAMRLSGKRPKLVLVSSETDGRFKRVVKDFHHLDGTLFFLTMPIQAFLTNEIYFQPFFRDYPKISGDGGRYVHVFERYYHPQNVPNREQYKRFCKKAMRFLKRWLAPDLIIIASPDDAYSVELSNEAQAVGIKWGIAEREGTHTGRSAKSLADLFRQYRPLDFDFMFAANELHLECYKNATDPSAKTKFFLIGELRSDSWVTRRFEYKHPNYATWNQFKHRVLFLTFGEKNYIEPMYHPHVKGSWLPLLHQCEESVEEFAARHPDSIIFYKMGHTEDFHQEFLDRCAKRGIQNVVPLNRAFPCEELISYCDVIIGFQSTAVLESMFTKKPILYPNWGFPEEVDREFDILPFYRCNALEVIASKDEMISALERSYDGTLQVTSEQVTARKEWIEQYFVKPDGSVAERFVSILQQELK